ncbi:beta-lactamase family protein [Mycobacterium kansasii]|uniref:Beta-lactamase family protein n=1 Tax=Mycobacterium kansasii TaxID=1768 RepID=A0A1V3WEU6_MYCKA|nr:beta-lactamase family protein [Mycobacterium kansasii]
MKLDGNQTSIREVCDAGLLSGAVTVVWQRGEVLQVNEIGYRDVDAGLPMQRDTLFRIASMTKPVTVAAAMSLVDEGKLALRDPSRAGRRSWTTRRCWTTRMARWTGPIRPGGPSWSRIC